MIFLCLMRSMPAYKTSFSRVTILSLINLSGIWKHLMINIFVGVISLRIFRHFLKSTTLVSELPPVLISDFFFFFN